LQGGFDFAKEPCSLKEGIANQDNAVSLLKQRSLSWLRYQARAGELGNDEGSREPDRFHKQKGQNALLI
jgi:hypothetical protein